MNLTHEQIQGMIDDAEAMESWPLAADVACHVKALAAEVEELRIALAERDELVNAVQPLDQWRWLMLGNGMRGWEFDGYLTDRELVKLCDLSDIRLPDELKEYRE